MDEPADSANTNTIGGWKRKFGFAIAGTLWAFRTQNSFWIHLPIAAIAIALGVFLQLDAARFAILTLAIAIVLAAELFNTALEQLVATLHPERDPRIAHARDAAAGAVLITAIAAATVGLILLLVPLVDCFV